jgi:hypothetical protein
MCEEWYDAVVAIAIIEIHLFNYKCQLQLVYNYATQAF